MRHGDKIERRNQSSVASELQTSVVVDWAWISGPLVLLAATMATLAVAMARNASRPLKYKDSAVALLGLGLGQIGPAQQPPAAVRVNFGSNYTAYQAELAASGLTAKLDRDANGEYVFPKGYAGDDWQGWSIAPTGGDTTGQQMSSQTIPSPGLQAESSRGGRAAINSASKGGPRRSAERSHC